MNLDSRLRAELREAVDAHDPRVEDALRRVKATQPDWADLTVVTLEAPDPSRATHPRTRRVVGLLAACALLAGAVALPVALRSRSRAAVAPVGGSVTAGSRCGPPVTAGYRSTAVLRIAAAPPASASSRPVPSIKLTDPVKFALGLCNAARAASHLHPGPGIGFDAKTNATGDLLSLSAVAPTPAGTDALAREWAFAFAVARKAEARDQIREQQRRLTRRVQALHRELRSVDTKLARLMPVSYGGVPAFDAANADRPGLQPGGPPPVPEQGGPHALNLAFERIQLLTKLREGATTSARLRIAAVRPDVYASVVSQSPAKLIRAPHQDTNTSTVLIAIGLLTAGVLLAGSAFGLGRRRRRPQTP